MVLVYPSPAAALWHGLNISIGQNLLPTSGLDRAILFWRLRVFSLQRVCGWTVPAGPRAKEQP